MALALLETVRAKGGIEINNLTSSNLQALKRVECQQSGRATVCKFWTQKGKKSRLYIAPAYGLDERSGTRQGAGGKVT